jgi:hypothetical protein
MKQTAVEWFLEEICSEKLSWNKDSNGKLFIDLTTSNIFNQAKEMEKEQMEEIREMLVQGALTNMSCASAVVEFDRLTKQQEPI